MSSHGLAQAKREPCVRRARRGKTTWWTLAVKGQLFVVRGAGGL